MGTNVRTDEGRDLVTQYANGTVLKPDDPVLLKDKGVPGVAPYTNDSTKLIVPVGTVYDHGTEVAHRQTLMDSGWHPFSVLRGFFTEVVSHPAEFLSYSKTLYHEARNAVMHVVEVGTNVVWSMLPKELQNAINNAGQVVGGLSAQDFKDAAEAEIQAMLDALMSTDTLIALAQTAALAGLSAVPVVGQLAGGAAVAQRVYGIVQGVSGAADELKGIVEEWTKPMTPEQIAAARKKLAAWLLKVGIAAILAAIGKVMPKLSGATSARKNGTDTVKVGTGSGSGRQTHCPCLSKYRRPVIIATGEKQLEQTDFELGAIMPLSWRRHYRSGLAVDGWFGHGWTLPLAMELWVREGQQLTFLEPAGRRIELPYLAVGGEHFDAYDRLTLRRLDEHTWTLSDPEGETRVFRRTSAEQWRLPLAVLADRNGNRNACHYPPAANSPFDRAPRPARIDLPDGRRLNLAWDDLGHLTEVGLAGAEPLARYAYSPEGDLITHRNATGAQTRYEWRQHVLVGYTLPDGGRYRAEYDDYSPTGHVLRSWAEADGRGLRFDYDPRARTTRVTDSLGRVTLYEHDGRRDIVATTGPDGQRIETPLDANGHPREIVDPLGRRTAYGFDRRGNLTDLVDPAGARTRIEYDALDLPVAVTDALGQRWLRDYDERGNLTAALDPLGQATRYQYDGHGQPIAIADARGGVKRLEWDAAGNLLAYTDCSNRRSQYAYDAFGRLIVQRDALNQDSHYQWDATGRLLSLSEPDGATHHYAWSAEGRLLAYTDPLGAVTRWHYDVHGDPLEREDANGHLLRYTYDAVGRLAALVNENGQATRFAYDLADNLTDEIGFDGRHQRYCYNAAGELTHLIEAGGSDFGPGKVTHFSRDALGRLTARSSEGNETCTARYRYDALGRLTAADNPAAKLAFAYDPAGRLTSEAQTLSGGQARMLAHAYDPLGNRTRTALPDGRALNWLFYGSGHLHQINLEENGRHQTVSDFERDAVHREIARSQGSADSYFDYDPAGRLLRHRAHVKQSATAAIERRYRYDAAGRLVGREDNRRGANAYRYDPTGRILAARGRFDEFFAFDPAGNLLEADPSHPPPIGRVAGNRLRVYQDLRFDYDVHGNVTNRRKGSYEEAAYTWNADHQLAEATVSRRGVTQTTRYEYDALGRRTRKADAFGSTEYLWDGDLMIESRRGNKTALFLFEPNSFVPLATIQDNETYWYHCDQIGAPLELTDAEGSIVWAADYKVWGEVVLRTGTDDRPAGTGWRTATTSSPPPIDQPFRFQGQQFDEETGLHYNRFRYYDPGVGRFVSQDPIGLWGGDNLFAYAQDTLNWIDPFGLAGKGATGSISGPNIPDGTVEGASTRAGGGGITNPAVQAEYDKVPKEKRSLYHGKCCEGDALSKAANAAGVKTTEDLKKMTSGATSTVYNGNGRYLPPCSSCKEVLNSLEIGAKK